jgi:hypothetical protein
VLYQLSYISPKTSFQLLVFSFQLHPAGMSPKGPIRHNTS